MGWNEEPGCDGTGHQVGLLRWDDDRMTKIWQDVS